MGNFQGAVYGRTRTNGGPDPARRTLLKGGAVAGAATASYGWIAPGSAQTTTPAPDPTPYLEPFLDPLTIPPVKTPTMLYPRPGRLPVPGEAGRDPHPRFDEFLPQREYELRA